MVPKSVLEDRRSRRAAFRVWLVFVAALMIGLLVMHNAQNGSLGDVSGLFVAVFGGGFALVLGFVLLEWDVSDENARTRFMRVFATEPDGEDRNVVQRAINGVLEGLRRKAVGAFGREVGAQRAHSVSPSDETVARLNECKEEAGRLKEAFWYAVKTADDWGFKVPKYIDVPIE